MARLKHYFRAWRKQTTKLTQEDIAGALGLDVSQISRIENGRDVTLTQLSELAAAIGQKNPLRLLFPPDAPELDLMDILYVTSGKTVAERRRVLRVAKAAASGEDEAA